VNLHQSEPPTDDDPGATCPECFAGKHRNCTGSVLVGDDTWVPCACGHCKSWEDVTIATVTRGRFRNERRTGDTDA
jgi:hypothetical protein